VQSERDQLRQLGNILLGPIAGHLAGKRLAVVPDGVLHYLPYAALGDPRSSTDYKVLADSNEIVVLPSASGLLGLRQWASSSGSQEYRVAILADPVFTADDPRLTMAGKKAGVSTNTNRMQSQTGISQADFPRLPGTRYEARLIEELIGPENALVLTGFSANRDQFTGGSLNEYNVLHLATHGIVNPTHPGLSGVVLSALDSEGQEQPPFVRALDLFYMDIGARLVVLSACETALGTEIRGEGLMGLTRGFFYAGANTVVSSLWQVPDRATAELMKHFYREMLQSGRPPAAALRLAQLKIRENRRWRDPYYWAAFTVQGDWK
jgi:CHAT domain-containing protein